MKKIINSKIFAFILGAVLFSGMTVYATNYLAKDVTYKDTNVENALNDLYEKSIESNECIEWQQLNNVVVSEASYLYSTPTIYKCGNVCKVSFTFNEGKVDTNYKLITDENYFPKEIVKGRGTGGKSGDFIYNLNTNGEIVITYQRNGNNWAADDFMYICS